MRKMLPKLILSTSEEPNVVTIDCFVCGAVKAMDITNDCEVDCSACDYYEHK